MSRTSFRVNLHSLVCLNVKELLLRSRRHIRRNHKQLVRKRTLNHLAKLVMIEGKLLFNIPADITIAMSSIWIETMDYF